MRLRERGIVWVAIRGRLFKCNPGHLRLAKSTESLVAELLNIHELGELYENIRGSAGVSMDLTGSPVQPDVVVPTAEETRDPGTPFGTPPAGEARSPSTPRLDGGGEAQQPGLGTPMSEDAPPFEYVDIDGWRSTAASSSDASNSVTNVDSPNHPARSEEDTLASATSAAARSSGSPIRRRKYEEPSLRNHNPMFWMMFLLRSARLFVKN